ncbi:MAG: glycoside hydrolase family 9 protein, partial [Oscillospiraceae bacterium]|nr:glycoside hydrolase family 9 protein [Oscillospiraceae bacterium]
MTEAFMEQLIQSGYIHRLLRPDRSKSAETRLLAKKAVRSRLLWDGASGERWQKNGEGEMREENGALMISAPARREFDSPMPHYTGFGKLIAALRFMPGENWLGYNRIRCKIMPECGGYHAPHLTMCLVNDGESKVPDVYGREGFHVVNLENRVWNECVWEFADLPRDCITELAFSLSCHGREMGGAENFDFYIKEITLEQAENPDVSLGWACARDAVCYSTSGYFNEGVKQAVTAVTGGRFELLDEPGGKTVYSGEISRVQFGGDELGIADFSGFSGSGRFRLRVNCVTTESFPICENPFEQALWKAVNYLYAERCGAPVPGGHGFCHGDILAEHAGKSMVYCGGWHDAGDLSQQTLQTAEVTHALLENAMRSKNSTLLYSRLMEEACWGLDFVLHTRFGDGYRATSVGNTRWTDLLIGTADDEKARVHNRSIDNFLMGGVEAYAATAFAGYDDEKSFIALKAAKEDYAFAAERFELVGCEDGPMMEHTYNAGLSQYYAAASWCASQIYIACGDDYYAREAARFGKLLLSCQDKGEAGLAFSGFFYRDANKKTLTYFNHQARYHLYSQALEALCRTQRDSIWEDALRRYGGYLSAMRRYASPYGMQPDGLHMYSEADDAETFPYLHIYTDYNSDRENYRKQLLSGTRLNDIFCVRQFPVWFSFRGNSAVLLSLGKAASVAGRYLGDSALMEIARDQLYWHAGK